ncbi:restriction endonuclease subunit S [Nocardia africana]|uniref:Restriction endonuclease subunit S n=1 Tax=Nocardia africana TaxID=134964 RepID=A0ABW6NQ70_9NOCA
MLPPGWAQVSLQAVVDVLDSMRIPINARERAERPGPVPYYGATGQVGWIDNHIFDEKLILLGEDGVQFLDRNKPKAYLISGKTWVNNHAHVLRARPELIRRRYLCHYLNFFDYRYAVNGTTRLKLTRSAMDRIPVLLPPLAEQRRIVEALEDHLSRLHAANAAVNAAERKILAFTGSVREQFLHSQVHRWGVLSDVLDRIEAGKSFTCDPRVAGPDEWGIIKVSAMTWGEFRANENKAVPYGRNIDPRYEIKSGDILVSRANTEAYVGAPVLVRKCRPKLLLSDKSLRLVPKAGIDKGWLVHVLASPSVRREISRRATGTKESMRNISQRNLASVPIPLPDSNQHSVELAASIDELLESTSRMAGVLAFAGSRAEHLRRSLLTQAFSGLLVPQDPTDEPAAKLLARIEEERGREPKVVRARRPRTGAPRAVPSGEQGELPL